MFSYACRARTNTNHPQQAIDLSVQHHKAGELPKAEGIYNQILQADPNQTVALHLLGVIDQSLPLDWAHGDRYSTAQWISAEKY